MTLEIGTVEVRIGKQEATPSKALFRDNHLIFEAIPVGKEFLSLPIDSIETKWGRSMRKHETPLIISTVIFFFFSMLIYCNNNIYCNNYVQDNALLKNIIGFLFFIYFLGFFIVFPWIGFIVGFTWVFLLLTYIKNKELILLTNKGEIRISGKKDILKNLEVEIKRRKSEYGSN